MKLIDPVSCVLNEQLAYRPAARRIKIDRLAPVGRMQIGEVLLGKSLEIVSVRTYVVINHVQNDTDAELVRSIDKSPHVVWPAVKRAGRIKIDAVVAPVEAARECSDWHHFHERYAGAG